MCDGKGSSKEEYMRESKNERFSTIDEYIRSFPPHIQEKLIEIRDVIKSEAPAATEKIAYQIPTSYLHGNLVHFAGFKNHIGFYPTPSAISTFKDELSRYKRAKGSVQFPLSEPLPVELIRKMVKYRVKENLGRKQRSSEG